MTYVLCRESWIDFIHTSSTFFVSVEILGGTSQRKLKQWGYHQTREDLKKNLISQVWATSQLPLPCYNDGTSAPSWCSCNQFIVTCERLCQTGAPQVFCLLLIKTSSHWSANWAGASGWQNIHLIIFQVTYSPMTSTCLMHAVVMLN